ncbi:MAG: hypothetical protein MHMPM18_005087 [Marteilia pararefringens]
MKRFAQKFSIDIFYDPNFQFYNLHDLSALQEIKYRVHKSQPVRTLDCKMPLDLLRQPSSPEGSTNDSKDSSKSKSKTGGIITPVVQTEEKDLEEEKSNAEESFSENSVDEPCDMVGLEFEKVFVALVLHIFANFLHSFPQSQNCYFRKNSAVLKLCKKTEFIYKMQKPHR